MGFRDVLGVGSKSAFPPLYRVLFRKRERSKADCSQELHERTSVQHAAERSWAK